MTRDQTILLVANEMAVFRNARIEGSIEKAWRALERAHIISQLHIGLHLNSHWEMLKFAVAVHDAREISGQLARLVLAPLGTLTGRIPKGNTGRSNVSAFAPMPIPDDLRDVIDEVAR